jgi:hypothetical protein
VVQVKIHTKSHHHTFFLPLMIGKPPPPSPSPFPTNSDTRFSSQLTHSVCDPFVCVCVCIGFGKIRFGFLFLASMPRYKCSCSLIIIISLDSMCRREII